MKENKRQVQKKATRSRIIDAAIRQFAKKGLTTTRTGDVAVDAGVSHGTIFVHFPTQEELLIGVIEEVGGRINLRLHELASDKKGIEDILRAHISVLMEFEEFYTRLVIESRLLPKQARDTYIMIQSTVSFHLSQSVQMEVDAGTMQNLPLDMVFNGWVGLVHYYLANSDLFAPGESVLKRYGEGLIQFYISLITKNEKKG